MIHNLVKVSAVVICAIGLTACGAKTPGAGGDLNGVGGALSGSASDPTSVAYFQEAIGDRVLFPVNQSTLTQEATDVLNGQANWLLQNTQYSVTIEGHADEQGTREYNLALGDRRAHSVSSYMVSRGIAGNRVKTLSYGKERPIEICSTEECWSKNRRAVTVVGASLGS